MYPLIWDGKSEKWLSNDTYFRRVRRHPSPGKESGRVRLHNTYPLLVMQGRGPAA